MFMPARQSQNADTPRHGPAWEDERRNGMSYTGQPLKRLEDPRLVTGNGSFVDDLHLPDMLYARVLRSPHAHAHIRSIDSAATRRLPGVVAVLNGSDLAGVLPDLPT